MHGCLHAMDLCMICMWWTYRLYDCKYVWADRCMDVGTLWLHVCMIGCKYGAKTKVPKKKNLHPYNIHT